MPDTLADPVETITLAAMAELSSSLMHAIRPEMTMRELGFDSLDEVELAMRIEMSLRDQLHREIDIPIDAFAEHVTVAQAVETIRKAVAEAQS